MKYIIYALLMLTGYGLSYGLLPLVLPMWLSIDVVLIFILCTAQMTKDYTAFVLGILIGITIDIIVAPAFGLYTLIYGVTGFIYAALCAKAKNDNILVAVMSIFIFYIIKDIALMIYRIVYGSIVPFWTVFLRMTLPSALATAACGLIGYLLVLKLHDFRALKIKKEVDLLRNYQEEYDWLGNWFEQFK